MYGKQKGRQGAWEPLWPSRNPDELRSVRVITYLGWAMHYFPLKIVEVIWIHIFHRRRQADGQTADLALLFNRLFWFSESYD